MQTGKMNTVRYCSAFISHCANYYFSNENLLNQAQLSDAQFNNYQCVKAALEHFEADEIDMLRNVFISGLPLPEAMKVLNTKGEYGWFMVRKFIKMAATYRGLI